MPNARFYIVALAAALLTACGGGEKAATNEENIDVDEGMPTGQIPANADVEMLPADESSATPSSELQNGITAPEANEAAENAE
ncbi:MAG TPA: hypothetical protein VIL42_07945 [Sphingomicrobium sp.]|jgi:hypothetical protein